MSIEQKKNSENREIETILNKEVSVTNTDEARARFQEIVSYLDAYRPNILESKQEMPLGISNDLKELEELAVWILSLTGAFILPITLPSLVLANTLLENMLLFGSSSVILSGITAFILLRSNDGRAKNKFRNWLCKVFLTKKLNTKVRENGIFLDEYDHSIKLYKLLVEKARTQMESEGVFELVNHRTQTEFIALDSMGRGEYLNTAEWQARSVTKPIQEKITNVKILQKEITSEILSAS